MTLKSDKVCLDRTPIAPLDNGGCLWWGPLGLMFGDDPVNPPAPTAILKIENTDTTTDLDSTTEQNFDELFGAVTINTNPANYAVNLATGSITVNTSGIYRFTGHFALLAGVTTVSQRVNLSSWFEIGGVEVSPRFQGNYARDATGHNEVSQSIEWIVELSAGDTVTLRRDLVAGQTGGQVTFEGTNNFLAVEFVSP